MSRARAPARREGQRTTPTAHGSLLPVDDRRMILPRRFRLLVLVLCVAALPASSALAGRKTAARPSVSSLSPPALAVGDTLTVRGRNFLPGKKRNSVVFKHDGGPEVTVKAAQATRTRMQVVVPATLAKYLTVAGGAARPARFRVRVVAGRSTSKGFTTLRRSPVIVPPQAGAGDAEELDTPQDGCDAGGAVHDVTGDPDTLARDILPAEEDPCYGGGDVGDDGP
jgi:hypothetical protein